MARPFFINPPARRRRRKRAISATHRKRNRAGRFVRATSGGQRMASRKRARRHVRRTVRRRRRRVAVAAHNPPRRRHRVRRYTVRSHMSNPRRRSHRRRHARRNPPAIVGNIVSDLQHGLGAWGGLVATRKIRGAITGMLPATAQATVSGTVGKIGLSLVSAIVTSIVARRVLPRHAAFITAGAFAEVIDCGVQATPVGAYFSAYPRLRAYPGTLPAPSTGRSVVAGGARALPARGLRAYPLPRAVGATA